MFSPASQSLVILQYHHISDSTPISTSLSPELFKQHLKYLKENDFEVLSLGAVLKSLNLGEKFKDKTVVITFDDGYRSVYETAFPLLKKYHYPFTIFVHTAPLENQLNQFVSWQNIKEMTNSGASIANHTVHHQHLIKKNIEDDWLQRKEMVIREILNSQKVLEQKASNVLKALAYPYGEFDQQTKKLLKTLGFIGFAQHSGGLSSESDLLAIPRFPLGGNYGDIKDFAIKVNSLVMPVQQVSLFDSDNNELQEHLIDKDVKKPKLEIQLSNGQPVLDIQCYSSRGNKLVKIKTENGYQFTPQNELPVGRSRYNCTASSKWEGRFYWFSQPWILADSDGRFYRQ